MKYDPIKRSLGKVFNTSPVLRKLFYYLLDMLLLRSWHVRKELRLWSYANPGKKQILDAGSGFGQYDYNLARINKKWEILGVDVKQEQINDCNGFFSKIGLGKRVKFEYADLTNFTKVEDFDLVLSVDVMEHILEDEEVFKGFHKALRPGGMVLISTPSDKGGSDTHHDHDHDEHEGIDGFIDEHVRDGYSIEDITTKLNRAGFKKVECRYTYGKPGKISWKLSMKFPIVSLNKTKLFFIVLPFYYIVTFPIALVLNYFDLKGKHKEGTGLLVKAWK